MLARAAHVLSGLLTALASLIDPSLVIVGFLVFFAYEATEQKMVGDQMFVEMREFGVGFFAGVLILLARMYIFGWW